MSAALMYTYREDLLGAKVIHKEIVVAAECVWPHPPNTVKIRGKSSDTEHIHYMIISVPTNKGGDVNMRIEFPELATQLAQIPPTRLLTQHIQ